MLATLYSGANDHNLTKAYEEVDLIFNRFPLSAAV